MPVTILSEKAIASAIDNIVIKNVVPALKKVSKSIGLAYKLRAMPTSVHFEQYLKRAYEKHRILNTIVYHNQRKTLKELYVPLTLIQDVLQTAKWTTLLKGILSLDTTERVTVTDYPRRFIEKYHRVLIKDNAGMGKSTLAKLMFLSAIDQEAGIPFFIELRNLSKEHLLLDEIQTQLCSLTKKFDEPLMRALFQAGGFIFFFDGFDEISGDERKEVIDDIKSFVEKAPDNYYIMTSRPDDALLGFGDYFAMNIEPLQKDEAYSLLNKYDIEGHTSKRLILKLEDGDYERIEEFMHNPLLVSLLFIGFDYRPDIPLKLHEFYDQVFVALFHRHDNSKDGYYEHKKESGLDINQFDQVLRAIGILSLFDNRLSYSRKEFLSLIKAAKELSCVSIRSEESMIDDLMKAVPLFFEDGIDIKWVHKSMMEYFAASFIISDSEENKYDLLKSITDNLEISYYRDCIELYSEMDVNGFNQLFILPFLDSFISYVERPIVAQGSDDINRIRIRRQFLFKYDGDCIMYFAPNSTGLPSRTKALDRIRGLIKDSPASHVRSVGNERFFIYATSKYDKCSESLLFSYILNKTPIQEEFPSKEYDFYKPKYVKGGQVYQVSEGLFLDDPNAYDEMNTLLAMSSVMFMSYERAKELRAKIQDAISKKQTRMQSLSRGLNRRGRGEV